MGVGREGSSKFLGLKIFLYSHETGIKAIINHLNQTFL